MWVLRGIPNVTWDHVLLILKGVDDLFPGDTQGRMLTPHLFFMIDKIIFYSKCQERNEIGLSMFILTCDICSLFLPMSTWAWEGGGVRRWFSTCFLINGLC